MAPRVGAKQVGGIHEKLENREPDLLIKNSSNIGEFLC